MANGALEKAKREVRKAMVDGICSLRSRNLFANAHGICSLCSRNSLFKLIEDLR